MHHRLYVPLFVIDEVSGLIDVGRVREQEIRLGIGRG